MAESSSLRGPRQDDVAGPLARRAPVVGGGRLAVYAAFGAAAGSLALPWLPDALSRRVRGALVHDVATRHNLSLTPDARAVLAEPVAPGIHPSAVASAARFLGGRLAARALRNVAPVGMIWPLGGALRTYVLGHLFDRYLEQTRSDRAVRIDVNEARRVRAAIERAFAHVLTVDFHPSIEPATIDDGRDAATTWIDGVLVRAAGIPERLVRRLEAAFDDALKLEGAFEPGSPA